MVEKETKETCNGCGWYFQLFRTSGSCMKKEKGQRLLPKEIKFQGCSEKEPGSFLYDESFFTEMATR